MSTDPTTNPLITEIKHSKSGASCKVHATGATIFSFVSSDGRENLFCSREAKMDGSKAIRGGIPICFPIFGPPKGESTMPQHGFARVNKWKLVSTFDEEAAAGATYTLGLADVTTGMGENNPWSIEQARVDETDCLLTYEIRLEAKQLTSTLIIQNTGKDSFDFQTLLHTYLAVDNRAAHDPAKTQVRGLGGYAITDKVSGDSGHVQSYDDPIVMEGETDRVYIHPDNHPTVHATILAGGETSVRVEAAGQVDEVPSPVSCVVWNPHIAKAAATKDMGDDEYESMVCVEPGLIGHQPLLAPGKEARMTQSIIV